MIQEFSKIKNVSGTIKIPGDKSISHRAVMFAALADGKSTIKNCLLSEDVLSTINCFRQLGIVIEIDGNTVSVWGKGLNGLQKPESELNAGNSGTTARLLSGILAMQQFESVITGDASLSKRPMERIVAPLKMFGCKVSASEKNTLPLHFTPSMSLKPITYKLPVASAQVKSSVLLAGLYLEGTTKVIEPVQTRNHTENLLRLTVDENATGKIISVSSKNRPGAQDYFVPSDISTASFFIVLALLIPKSNLVLKNILLNDTRNAVLLLLQKMGASIEIKNVKVTSGEKYGDMVVCSSKLHNIDFNKEIIPNIIDEIPILSIAGYFAEGKFVIRNAEELRKKESDRISSICRNFELLGADVQEFADGFSIAKQIEKDDLTFNSFGDHRIAMAFSILASLLQGGGKIKNFECVSISNPLFMEQLGSITAAQ